MKRLLMLDMIVFLLFLNLLIHPVIFNVLPYFVFVLLIAVLFSALVLINLLIGKKHIEKVEGNE